MWETVESIRVPGKMEVHRPKKETRRMAGAEDWFRMEAIDENWKPVEEGRIPPFPKSHLPRVEEGLKERGWKKIRVWRLR